MVFLNPWISDVFLSDFIAKAKDLLTNGIGIHLKVTIKGFVCDATANTVVLKTKGYSGFS